MEFGAALSCLALGTSCFHVPHGQTCHSSSQRFNLWHFVTLWCFKTPRFLILLSDRHIFLHWLSGLGFWPALLRGALHLSNTWDIMRLQIIADCNQVATHWDPVRWTWHTWRQAYIVLLLHREVEGHFAGLSSHLSREEHLILFSTLPDLVWQREFWCLASRSSSTVQHHPAPLRWLHSPKVSEVSSSAQLCGS